MIRASASTSFRRAGNGLQLHSHVANLAHARSHIDGCKRLIAAQLLLQHGYYSSLASPSRAGQTQSHAEMQCKRQAHTSSRRWTEPAAGKPASAGPSPAAATPPPPFPFLGSSSYSSFLDMVERIVGHRFRNPVLLHSVFFHSHIHQCMTWLGNGLLRHYSSTFLYTLYPHYDEGHLTKIKDTLMQGGEMNRWTRQGGAMDLTPAIHTLERYKHAWISSQHGAETRAITRRLPVSPIGDLNALADIYPLVLPGDMYESLIGALYLDGGWAASDRFARRTILPAVGSIQHRIRRHLPDADLSRHDYRRMLQSFGQRVFAMTPTILSLEMKSEDNARHQWLVRADIKYESMASEKLIGELNELVGRYIEHDGFGLASPLLDAMRTEGSEASDAAPSTSAHTPSSSSSSPPSAFHPSSTTPPINRHLPLCVGRLSGTKRVAELRAARYAYQRLLAEWRKGTIRALDPSLAREETKSGEQVDDNIAAIADGTSEIPKRLKPAELRSALHALAAKHSSSPATSDSERSAISIQLLDIVRVLTSAEAKWVVYPLEVGDKTNEGSTDGDGIPSPLSIDPFESALALLPPMEQGTDGHRIPVPKSPSTLSPSSSWHMSDYTTLISLLHHYCVWSCFPSVWALLVDVHYVLTASTCHQLIDGFTHCTSMAVIIQLLRVVRRQRNFTPDIGLYEHALYGCTRCSPGLAWKQVMKIMKEMDEQRCTMRLTTYNTALYAMTGSLWHAGEYLLRKSSHMRKHTETEKTDSTDTSSDMAVDAGEDQVADHVDDNGEEESDGDDVVNAGERTSHPHDDIPASNLKDVVADANQLLRRLRSHHASSSSPIQPDLLTLACVAIIHTYSGRVEIGWRIVAAMERRSQLRLEVDEWCTLIQYCVQPTDSETFDPLNPPRPFHQASRSHPADHVEAAHGVIQAVAAIMRQAEQHSHTNPPGP